jgi:hypothetical protein
MEGRQNVRRRLNFDDVESGDAVAGPNENSPEMGGDYLNIIQEEMRTDLDIAKQRWNFDFENEVPLEGRWQWEKVSPSEPSTVQEQPEAENEEPENGLSELEADSPEH